MTLPLRDVDFDIVLGAGETDGRVDWPPLRFRPRDARLTQLSDFWQGDMSSLVSYEDADDVAIPINYFRFIVQDYVTTLMSSTPTVEGVDPELFSIRAAADDALTDALRYGGALLWAGINTLELPFISAVSAKGTGIPAAMVDTPSSRRSCQTWPKPRSTTVPRSSASTLTAPPVAGNATGRRAGSGQRSP